jgi:hypothetical protein
VCDTGQTAQGIREQLRVGKVAAHLEAAEQLLGRLVEVAGGQVGEAKPDERLN